MTTSPIVILAGARTPIGKPSGSLASFSAVERAGLTDDRVDYAYTGHVTEVVGREIRAQIRPAGWLESGIGSLHDTLVARPMVEVFPVEDHDRNDEAVSTARSAS